MVFGRFARSQFIEVIEWVDDSPNTLVYRFPVEDKEIKMNAQLTVRETQKAVFVNEGQIADIFDPGRYELTTQNMPVLTKLKSWKYGFESPFKAEVYFINTRRFPDQKWGTSNPVMMRDQEFGMVRFRAFGVFGFRVHNPDSLIKEIVGTSNIYTTDDIVSQLKNIIVSGLSGAVAESQIPVLDLSMNYGKLAEVAMKVFEPQFNQYGLSISSFVINNISLPKEVEEAMDRRTSMGVVGDMGQYTQYQAAEAMRDAAQNEGGGAAGAGVGFGAGMGLGNMMAGAMNQSMNQQQGQVQQNQQQEQQTSTTACPGCSAQIRATAKFCPECGKTVQQQDPKITCPGCSAQIRATAKFCPECGKSMQVQCSCGHTPKPGAKFCGECGTSL